MAELTTALKWLGGGLFIVSLATATYAYAVTWAESIPLATSWPTALLIDALLVTGFAFHHSLFARDPVKALMARVMPADLVRSLYVWIASLLFIAVIWAWQPVGGQLYRVDAPLAWLLNGLQLAGAGLVAAAVRAIDGLELAGIRAPAPITPLSVRGPYRLVRHPLYLGWMLIVAATPHMTGDRLAFATLTTLYLVIAVPWEERALHRAYGDAYGRYAHEVKSRFVPFVY